MKLNIKWNSDWVHYFSKFRPQELNNLAWGFARLGHYGSDSFNKLFQGIGIELKKRPKRFAAQDICTSMWSFASVEYFDEEVFRTATSEISSRDASSFKPQEMSNTVWIIHILMNIRFAFIVNTCLSFMVTSFLLICFLKSQRYGP